MVYSLPKKLHEFYQLTVHLVFAIVIGQGFVIASSVIIPIEDKTSTAGIIAILSLIFAYFVVVTSWIGYFKTITINPHKANALGTARFAMDLLILFLFYYLIDLTKPQNAIHYEDTFVWLLPAIFIAFIIWEFLKYFEYKNDKNPLKRIRISSVRMTIVYIFLFGVQSSLYSYFVNHNTLLLNGINVWNTIFIVCSFGLVGTFRWFKWQMIKYRVKGTTGETHETEN